MRKSRETVVKFPNFTRPILTTSGTSINVEPEAYYSFDSFSNTLIVKNTELRKDANIFYDKTSRNNSLQFRSGTSAGQTTGAEASLTYSPMFGLSGSTTGAPGPTTVSFTQENVKNTNTMINARRLHNCVDFDDIGDKFLLLEPADSLNPMTGSLVAGSNPGKTFMLRLRIKPYAVGQTFNEAAVLSISDSNTTVFSIYVSALAHHIITISAKAHLTSSPKTVVLGQFPANYGSGWLTVFVSCSDSQVGPISTFRIDNGSKVGFAGAISFSNPQDIPRPNSVNMYLGYGDGGSAPQPSFPTSDFLKFAQLGEVVVFKGILSEQEKQQIANSHLANEVTSGFVNQPLRSVIRDIEKFSVYPSTKRTGDQFRLGNRGSRFDDTRTFIFSSSSPTGSALVSPPGTTHYQKPPRWLAVSSVSSSIVFPMGVPSHLFGDGYNQFSSVRGTPASSFISMPIHSGSPGHLIGDGPGGKKAIYGLNAQGSRVLLTGAIRHFSWDFMYAKDADGVRFSDRSEYPRNLLLANPLTRIYATPWSSLTHTGSLDASKHMDEDYVKTQRNRAITPGKKAFPAATVNKAGQQIKPAPSTAPELEAKELIRPFDDSSRDGGLELPDGVLIRNKRASTIDGFGQRLGSRIAIEIDISTGPNDSTVGTSAYSDATSGLGATMTRQSSTYSYVYYDFKSKSWGPPKATGYSLDYGSYLRLDQGNMIPRPADLIHTVYQWDSASPPNTGSNGRNELRKKFFNSFIELCALPIVGTKGFTVYPGNTDPLAGLQSRARPTDVFGFPYAGKYTPKDKSLLDLSDYITEPFLLEGVRFDVDMKIEDMGPDSLAYKMPRTADTKQLGPTIDGNAAGGTKNNIWQLPYHGGQGAASTRENDFTAQPIDTVKTTYYDPVWFFGRAAYFGGTPGTIHGGSHKKMGPNNPWIPYHSEETYGGTTAAKFLSNAGSTTNDNSEAVSLHMTYAGNAQGPQYGVPYWRCDTFFINRERPGSFQYEKKFPQTDLSSSNFACSVTGPNYIGNPGKGAGASKMLRTKWPINPFVSSSDTALDYDTPASPSQPYSYFSGSTRELVTYAQVTHYGYATSEDTAQLFKSGLYNNYGFNGAKVRPLFAVAATASIGVTGFGGWSNNWGGGAGYISTPTRVWSALTESVLIQHPDMRDYGTFETAGRLTGKTLLEAGLGRDLNVPVSSMNKSTGYGKMWYDQWTNEWNSVGALPRNTFPRADNKQDSGRVLAQGSYSVFAPCRTSGMLGNVGSIQLSWPERGVLATGGTDVREGWVIQCSGRLDTLDSGLTRNPPNELGSSRAYKGSVAGVAPTENRGSVIQRKGPLGTPARLVYNNNVGPSIVGVSAPASASVWFDRFNIKQSGEFSENYDTFSPYMLYPEDKISIGFAPALAGMNEGYPISLNAAGSVFDNTSLDELSAANRESQPKYNNDALQQSAGKVTFPANKPGKLTLYGTLVSNQRPVPTSLNQDLTTVCVHEVIGNETVSDQYQTGQIREMAGGYTSHTITGSYFYNFGDFLENLERDVPGDPRPENQPPRSNRWFPRPFREFFRQIAWGSHQADLVDGGPGRSIFDFNFRFTDLGNFHLLQSVVGDRGLAGKYTNESFSSSLGVTGSLQRFVKLLSPSETFYDSHVPPISEIWNRDKKFPRITNLERTTTGNTTTRGGIHAEIRIGPDSNYNVFTSQMWPYNARVHNVAWSGAFPFESRYVDLPRVQDPEINSLMLKESTYWVRSGSNLQHEGLPTGYSETVSGEFSIRHVKVTVVQAASASADTAWKSLYTSRVDRYGNPLFYQSAVGIAAQSLLMAVYGTGNALSGTLYGANSSAHSDDKNVAGSWLSPYENYERRSDRFEHPTGFKYGLQDIFPRATCAHYRSDRFGQFRDMLEQRRYGRFFKRQSPALDVTDLPGFINFSALTVEPRILLTPLRTPLQQIEANRKFRVPNNTLATEGAITCRFIDGDGNVLGRFEHQETDCGNLSTFATSSIPFFEGDPLRDKFLGITFPASEVSIDMGIPQFRPGFFNIPS